MGRGGAVKGGVGRCPSPPHWGHVVSEMKRGGVGGGAGWGGVGGAEEGGSD